MPLLDMIATQHNMLQNDFAQYPPAPHDNPSGILPPEMMPLMANEMGMRNNSLNDMAPMNGMDNVKTFVGIMDGAQRQWPLGSAPPNYSRPQQVDYGATQSAVNYTANVNASGASMYRDESKMFNMSSTFPFQNPFLGNPYPTTNPPVTDSTKLLSSAFGLGVNRRRCISISNGQIGQIVNHEGFFLDEDLTDSFYDQSRQMRLHLLAGPPSMAQDDTALISRNQKPIMPGGVGRMDNMWYNSFYEQAHMANSAMDPIKVECDAQVQGPRSNVASNSRVTSVADTSGVTGVPRSNHLLIYNKELIFKPIDSFIQGTADSKKQRLLERNRVAALKSRQRKKHAQQQLQYDMNEVEKLVKEKEKLIERYDSLLEIYNDALKRHFSGEKDVLEALRPHIDSPILDFKP